jgi:transposase
VVVIYMNPPEHAAVCCVDEKTGIQVLNRTQPILPMRPGQVERRTHDYVRNGITDLFAALNVATGEVIATTRRRHRAEEFKAFLIEIDKPVPDNLEVHVVLDNSSTHKTPAIKTWLLRHPRFHFHFTPTSSSWLNLVERWFAELTRKLLQRSAHRSLRALEADLRAWTATWNENPRPSSGVRQQTRSWSLLPDTASGSLTQVTRAAALIGLRTRRRDPVCRQREGGSGRWNRPGARRDLGGRRW